ncbi:hypothetical protein IRT45_00895 [Nocardia sp. BSTN01]|uniref:WXG100-like domain-containing protein n=1 Tax=Nocardia sp. BSTN01 TaxID=2783665 RepID=UPI00188EADA0|nr:hypothetical protein [Nocardia sp. BSTN01]MBF4995709.1 hypothetical protein [Nocardia sp. BSTN01]
MSLYLPPPVRPIAWVAGASWPDGDEDKMWAVSRAWEQASKDLAAQVPGIESAKNAAMAAFPAGDAADQIGKLFDVFLQGDQSLATLAESFKTIGDSTFDVGTELQSAKINIIVSLCILLVEIAWAWLFPPTAPAVEAAAIGTTRSIVKFIADALQNALERAWAKLGFATRGELNGASRYWFKHILSADTWKGMKGQTWKYKAKTILPTAKGMGVYTVKFGEGALWAPVTNAIVQGAQIADGKRHGFNWKEFGASWAASALSTIPSRELGRYMGFGISNLDKKFGGAITNMPFRSGFFLQGATIGATAGVFGNIFGNLGAGAVTGDIAGAFAGPEGWVGSAARGGMVGGMRGLGTKTHGPDSTDPRFNLWMNQKAPWAPPKTPPENNPLTPRPVPGQTQPSSTTTTGTNHGGTTNPAGVTTNHGGTTNSAGVTTNHGGTTNPAGGTTSHGGTTNSATTNGSGNNHPAPMPQPSTRPAGLGGPNPGTHQAPPAPIHTTNSGAVPNISHPTAVGGTNAGPARVPQPSVSSGPDTTTTSGSNALNGSGPQRSTPLFPSMSPNPNSRIPGPLHATLLGGDGSAPHPSTIGIAHGDPSSQGVPAPASVTRPTPNVPNFSRPFTQPGASVGGPVSSSSAPVHAAPVGSSSGNSSNPANFSRPFTQPGPSVSSSSAPVHAAPVGSSSGNSSNPPNFSRPFTQPGPPTTAAPTSSTGGQGGGGFRDVSDPNYMTPSRPAPQPPVNGGQGGGVSRDPSDPNYMTPSRPAPQPPVNGGQGGGVSRDPSDPNYMTPSRPAPAPPPPPDSTDQQDPGRPLGPGKDYRAKSRPKKVPDIGPMPGHYDAPDAPGEEAWLQAADTPPAPRAAANDPGGHDPGTGYPGAGDPNVDKPFQM